MRNGLSGARITGPSKALLRKKGRASSLAPMKPTSNLELKKWRRELFPSASPASKQEVELLGEWLNSVLAENIEKSESPMDVYSNAQHWFSVAFNELVRQVSVDCAERGRLFAVIWKRNQDLLSKLADVQRGERKYILSCHREKIKKIKSDLELCRARWETLSQSYDEDVKKWEEARAAESVKIKTLQEKLDEQILSRQKVIDEIEKIREKLGMKPIYTEDKEEPGWSFDPPGLSRRLRKLRRELREDEAVDLNHIKQEIDNIRNYVSGEVNRYAMGLPANVKAVTRTLQWAQSVISYIYNHYMVYLTSRDNAFDKCFSDFVYELFLGIYGTRGEAERVLMELLSTVQRLANVGNSRIRLFVGFYGLLNKLPAHMLHFYAYVLTVVNRNHTGRLFPELQTGDTSVAAIPSSVAIAASSEVFERFASGLSLKVYKDRVNRIAAESGLRFGGKNLADMDEIIDYILSVYEEECNAMKETAKANFQRLPFREIRTFSEFTTMMHSLKYKPDARLLPAQMREGLKDGVIDCDTFLKIVEDNRLNLPVQLTQADFLNKANTEDLLKFMQMEFQDHMGLYSELIRKFEGAGDDMVAKQLKTAKTKCEQAFASRNLGKTCQIIQREFYEKLQLALLISETML